VQQRGTGRRDEGAALDQETLRRVRARDPAALGRFFDGFYPRVYGHVAHLVGDPVLAEDLTQDAFLRMHRAIDRLDPERDPAAWVFTVTINTVRDHWRSREHKRGQQQADLDPERDLSLPNGGPGAHEKLEREEAARAVQQALRRLTETDREVILLRSYEELDSTVTGEIMGISPEAVRQRHRRALARLGEAYRESARSQRGGP
jgi:RNA polymerase sigma-70 factor (ECF subfamily)